jgi:hypothetical protein
MDEPTPNLTATASYREILGFLRQCIKYVNVVMDDDRVECKIFGFEIKIWRTRINCRTRWHMGYKAAYWERYSQPDSPERFATILYDHRGRGQLA